MDTADSPFAPDPWLWRCAPGIAAGSGRVLDLACGSGRNALWLARQGWRVVGVDADPAKVAAARAAALRLGLSAAFSVQRVTSGQVPAGPWEGLCVFHFLNRSLFPELAGALAPDGWLLFKTHLAHPLRTPGRRPNNPDYLLHPGELLGAFPSLVPVVYREWVADGVAWAALLARRRPEEVAGLPLRSPGVTRPPRT